MEKEAKKALFHDLYQLDEEDSGEEDQSNASVILRQSRLGSDVSARIPISRLIHSSRPEKSLLRTVSAPLPQLSTSTPFKANVVEKSSNSSMVSPEPSKQVIVNTPVMAKKTTGITAQKGTSKTNGKRKRGQSLELKPESQQIFNGLAFCGSHCL